MIDECYSFYIDILPLLLSVALTCFGMLYFYVKYMRLRNKQGVKGDGRGRRSE